MEFCLGLVVCSDSIFGCWWKYTDHNHISREEITQTASFSPYKLGGSRSSSWTGRSSALYHNYVPRQCQLSFTSNLLEIRYVCWIYFHLYPRCDCIGKNVRYWLAVLSPSSENLSVCHCYSNSMDDGVYCDHNCTFLAASS